MLFLIGWGGQWGLVCAVVHWLIFSRNLATSSLTWWLIFLVQLGYFILNLTSFASLFFFSLWIDSCSLLGNHVLCCSCSSFQSKFKLSFFATYLQLLYWTHLDIWGLFMFPNLSPFWRSAPFPWGQLSPLEHLTLQLRALGLAPSTLICKASPAQNKDAIPHRSVVCNIGRGTNKCWNNWGAAAALTDWPQYPACPVPSTQCNAQYQYPK